MLSARTKPRMELSLLVQRADGTVEDLGVVAKSHPSLKERVLAYVGARRSVGRVR